MSSNTGGDNGDEQDNEDGGLGLTAQMEEKTIAEEIEEKKENEKKENEKNGNEKNENEKKEKEASMQILKRKIPKKTKLEKSIEVLSNGFRAAAEKETEMMVKLEQMRHKEMLEHEIRLKELENERRREERQHELLLLNVLSQNRNQVASQDVHFGQQHMMYGNMNRMNPPASTVSQDESFGTYYKL